METKNFILSREDADKIRSILMKSYESNNGHPIVVMPNNWVTYNGGCLCDLLLGPCSCKATH